MKRSGVIYIIAAPSGAGKTSLVSALVERVNDLTVSVSYTTRPQRHGEVDGEAYHFIDRDLFNKMDGDHDFLESAEVFDHRYGTSESWVSEQLEKGVDVILEIDWQGAMQVRKKLQASRKHHVVSIFILPPSLKALKIRLQARNQDSNLVVARRMKDAEDELSHWKEFEYYVVNDVFEHALVDLQTIIQAQKQRTTRIGNINQLVLLDKAD